MPLPAAPSRPSPHGSPSAIARGWQRLRRATLARRRLFAALLAAVATLAAVRAVSAPAEPTVPVVVARTDLPGGRPLGPSDVEIRQWGEDAVPAGAAPDPAAVVGRLLAAPVRRGEPLTDVRLVTPDLLEGYPGLVAAPVRVADAGVVGLLRVGDRVDLVAADPGGAKAATVAVGVPVVAIPTGEDDPGGLLAGGLVVVAVDDEVAVTLARVSVSSVLSVILTG